MTLVHNCSITIILLIYLMLSYSITALQAGDDVKKLIIEISGITDEDAAFALKKNAVTIYDVYALAVKNTERMLIQGEFSVQATARRAQAFGAFLPKVSLRGNKYFPDNNSSSQRTTVSLYARQPIITGLNEYSAFKGSISDVKIKKYEMYNNASQLLLDVASNFYNVIQIEKSLKNNEEILNLYNLIINELNRRVAIGRSRQSEVERTNSELYKLEAIIKSLRNDLTHTKISAKILTGIENINLIESGELPDPVFKIDDAKSIVDKRWDVKTAGEQVEYSKARVISTYGEHLPSVYLDGAYILYQEKKPANTRDYYFSLGAEIPLFSGGMVIAKVKEAESIKRQAELNLSKTIRLAEQDIIDAYQSWESSMKEAEAFKKALVSAEENYNSVRNEYRLNLVTILDVITSLKSLQSARDDYERTILQHKLNRIRLGVATNELSGKNISILKSKK